MTAKKFLSLLLAALMVLSLVACSSSTTTPGTSADVSTPADSQSTDSSAEEPSSLPADESNSAPVSDPALEDSEPDVSTESGGAFAGVSLSMPLVTEPSTLKFWWPSVQQMLNFDMSSAEDYLYFTEMEKRSGVTVEIEVPNDPQTQFGLMMASQDYPDFIEYFGSYYTQGMDHAIEEDLIVPLEEYAEYLPNIMGYIEDNIDIRRAVLTDEGHLPGIPTFSMRRFSDYRVSGNWAGYVVRQDWLDELNLDVPTTYDQLTTVLEGMKVNHGAEAIPFELSSYNGAFMMAMGSMFWSGYGFTADWMQKDGQVMYSLTQDSYRDYLLLLNSWYEAGYLDPDLMSKVVLWTTAPTAVSEQYAVFPIIYTHMGDILNAAQAEIPEYALSPIAPLKRTEDAEEHVCVPSGRASVNSCIMADSEYIELVCQWWDYFFSPEGVILGNYGIEHEQFEYNEEGIPTWIPEAFSSDDPTWNLSSFQYKNLMYNTPGYIENDREFCMVDQTALDMLDFWNENSGDDWNYPSAATMTAEESEEYASVMGDIGTYVSECAAKFLIGEMSFDDWDSYVAKIEQMGLANAVDCKQAALDRFNNR